MLAKARGTQNALKKMVDLVAEATAARASQSVRLVLTHCNCPGRAEELREALLAACPALGEIPVFSQGGLSSMYANEGGVIVAF
mgnify:CR=1 FL=1